MKAFTYTFKCKDSTTELTFESEGELGALKQAWAHSSVSDFKLSSQEPVKVVDLQRSIHTLDIHGTKFIAEVYLDEFLDNGTIYLTEACDEPDNEEHDHLHKTYDFMQVRND